MLRHRPPRGSHCKQGRPLASTCLLNRGLNTQLGLLLSHRCRMGSLYMLPVLPARRSQHCRSQSKLMTRYPTYFRRSPQRNWCSTIDLKLDCMCPRDIRDMTAKLQLSMRLRHKPPNTTMLKGPKSTRKAPHCSWRTTTSPRQRCMFPLDTKGKQLMQPESMPPIHKSHCISMLLGQKLRRMYLRSSLRRTTILRPSCMLLLGMISIQ